MYGQQNIKFEEYCQECKTCSETSATYAIHLGRQTKLSLHKSWSEKFHHGPTTGQLDDGDDDNAAACLNIYDTLQGLWEFHYCTHSWPNSLKSSITNEHLQNVSEMCSTLHLPAYNYPITIEPCHYPGGKQCIVIYYNDFRTSIYSSFVSFVLQIMTSIYEIINWCMELSMDVLVFCNDATLQRYSPNTWLKILSKLTSFFFSRYLCITLRTLKTEEELVNRGRHIPVSNKSHFCSSWQVYKHHVSRFS